jgi:hypothetical protein
MDDMEDMQHHKPSISIPIPKRADIPKCIETYRILLDDHARSKKSILHSTRLRFYNFSPSLHSCFNF